MGPMASEPLDGIEEDASWLSTSLTVTYNKVEYREDGPLIK